jgi:hypothetical protein
VLRKARIARSVVLRHRKLKSVLLGYLANVRRSVGGGRSSSKHAFERCCAIHQLTPSRFDPSEEERRVVYHFGEPYPDWGGSGAFDFQTTSEPTSLKPMPCSPLSAVSSRRFAQVSSLVVEAAALYLIEQLKPAADGFSLGGPCANRKQ